MLKLFSRRGGKRANKSAWGKQVAVEMKTGEI